MTEQCDVKKQTEKAVQPKRAVEKTMRPAVDIFEDDSGITVHADMPGVSRQRLDIEVDRDTLSIEGLAEIGMSEDLESLYADVRPTRYQRSFTLSHELDGHRAEASLQDGVLKLRIPKREQYQPRKIDVRVC